jgi:hypothetical protein
MGWIENKDNSKPKENEQIMVLTRKLTIVMAVYGDTEKGMKYFLFPGRESRAHDGAFETIPNGTITHWHKLPTLPNVN